MEKKLSKELLSYFNGNEFAAKIWIEKYAQPGEVTPDDMHRRMAKEFALVEFGYTSSVEVNGARHLSEYGQKLWETLGELNVYELEERIYQLFKDFKYIIPQGSVMSMLGNPKIGSLSNCFVIGQPEDSYGGIFQKDQEQAQLMKRRGGVGQDISTLRPEGTATSNAAKSSTGAVSFMNRFSNTTEEVAQNGRRGALMLSMHINHPDIGEFIKIKRDLSKITGANISIKISDEFMSAVVNDEDFILRWPCDTKIEAVEDYEDEPYNKLRTIFPGKYIKRIKAKEYWDEIIESAHGYAEPGIMFESKHIHYSPDGVYAQFVGVTTNPCGEIFMPAYDACRLIAINLFSFVENPFTYKAWFNVSKFYNTVYEAMRLSDDLVDLELEAISKIIGKIGSDPESSDVKRTEMELWVKIQKVASASRRTGLGITALADTVAALGVGYSSDRGLEIIELISKTKMKAELDCTIDLAILRGTFDGWDGHKEFVTKMDSYGKPVYGNNEFYDMLVEEFPDEAHRMMIHGRRNVSWSTIAPTGSLSALAKTVNKFGVTSGMEPVFMSTHTRRKKVNAGDKNSVVDFTDENGQTWQEYNIVMGAFEDWVDIAHPDLVSADLENMSAEDIKILVEQSPWWCNSAPEIPWEKRIKIQSVLQRYVTHSISSTINLPEDISKEVVSNIYAEAWANNLKGITVYRDKSRSGVLLTDNNKFEQKDAIKRPKELEARTFKFQSKGVHYTAIIGLLENKPYEIFLDKSNNKYSSNGRIIKKARGKYIFKNGGDPIDILSFMSDEEEAITRLVSANLRHGTAIEFVVEQLQKTPGDIFSFTKGLARTLKNFISDGTKSTVTCQNPDCTGDRTNVYFEEGCMRCQDCGSSACN